MFESGSNDLKRKSESMNYGGAAKKSRMESSKSFSCSPDAVSLPKPTHRQHYRPLPSLVWGNYKIPKKEVSMDTSEANVRQMSLSTSSSPTSSSTSTLSPATTLTTRDHEAYKGYIKSAAFLPQPIYSIQPSSSFADKKFNQSHPGTASDLQSESPSTTNQYPRCELLSNGIKMIIRFPKAQ